MRVNKLTGILEEIISEKELWVGNVKTKWKPAPGLFEKSASELAKYLKDNSSDLKQAMSRLVFYINRAGKNLKSDDRKRLENAKDMLRKSYG